MRILTDCETRTICHLANFNVSLNFSEFETNFWTSQRCTRSMLFMEQLMLSCMPSAGFLSIHCNAATALQQRAIDYTVSHHRDSYSLTVFCRLAVCASAVDCCE